MVSDMVDMPPKASESQLNASFDRASTLVERVYKAWFGLDGVYFNRDQVDYVAARTAPEYYAEARSRVPYPPWYPTRYLFAGRKEA